jgi:hypothetical protein
MPTPADGIAAVIAKIRDRLPQAADQLDQTAVVIGKVACRHLLIDISAYSKEGREVPSQSARIEVGGFSKSSADQVLNATSAAIAEENVAIDKVTLCWRTLVLIENKIRAIVQNPVTAPGPMAVRSSFNYEGWTGGLWKAILCPLVSTVNSAFRVFEYGQVAGLDRDLL